MIARPCAGCGDIIATGSRCPDCRPQETPRSHVAYANNARWKNTSKRLRKASPFCEQCGAVEMLTVDHIIPESVAPELAYAEENLRVLCHADNSSRQDRYTTDEAHGVLTRLQAAYNRRPTRKGRDRIAAAQRAIQDQGEGTQRVGLPTDVKAYPQLHIGGDLARRS